MMEKRLFYHRHKFFVCVLVEEIKYKNNQPEKNFFVLLCFNYKFLIKSSLFLI